MSDLLPVNLPDRKDTFHRDPANQTIATGGSKFHVRRIAMKGVLAIRKVHGKQIAQEDFPAAIGQSAAAAQPQQSTAPPIHELLEEFLLRRREVVRLDPADDDALIFEELIDRAGKPC